MGWTELNWTELNWTEVNWGDVKWSEVKWTEVKWGELKWTEVKWTEVNWSEVKWTEVKWTEVRWSDWMSKVLPRSIIWFYPGRMEETDINESAHLTTFSLSDSRGESGEKSEEDIASQKTCSALALALRGVGPRNSFSPSFSHAEPSLGCLISIDSPMDIDFDTCSSPFACSTEEIVNGVTSTQMSSQSPSFKLSLKWTARLDSLKGPELDRRV